MQLIFTMLLIGASCLAACATAPYGSKEVRNVPVQGDDTAPKDAASRQAYFGDLHLHSGAPN